MVLFGPFVVFLGLLWYFLGLLWYFLGSPAAAPAPPPLPVFPSSPPLHLQLILAMKMILTMFNINNEIQVSQ